MTPNGKYLNAIYEAGTMKNGTYPDTNKFTFRGFIILYHSVTRLITFINLDLLRIFVLFPWTQADTHEPATRGAETAGAAQPTAAAAQGAVAMTNQGAGTTETAQPTAQAANERAGVTGMVQPISVATNQGDGTTRIVLQTAATAQTTNTDAQPSGDVNQIETLQRENRELTNENAQLRKDILDKTEHLKVCLP